MQHACSTRQMPVCIKSIVRPSQVFPAFTAVLQLLMGGGARGVDPPLRLLHDLGRHEAGRPAEGVAREVLLGRPRALELPEAAPAGCAAGALCRTTPCSSTLGKSH